MTTGPTPTGPTPTGPQLDEAGRALLDRATAAVRAGQWQEARGALEVLLRQAPDQPNALQLLGIVSFQAGRIEDAHRHFRRAAELLPQDADALYNLASTDLHAGRLVEAGDGLRRVLALQPRHAGAQVNLSGVLHRQGRLNEALTACEAAIDLDAGNALAHLNYANLLREASRPREALAHFKTCLELEPDRADAHHDLGLLLRESGNLEAAAREIQLAVRTAPDNPQYRTNLRDTYRRMIPSWHFSMLDDQARNAAYDRAIAKAAPGRRLVLDIGTGSGLLAMMAARAGAERIVGCEAVQPLAEIARQIIARNGYADRITVIPKRSTMLRIGEDLPEPADLLISEVLDAGLIGEGVLTTLRHATASLIAPDAAIIPRRAVVSGIIVECPELRRINPIGRVGGFDLSLFDVFRNPAAHRQFDMAREAHRPLTASFEIARFDFRAPPNGEVARRLEPEIIADGAAQALVFWFDLHLDDAIVISTRPGGDLTHWRQAILFLDGDTPVKSGERRPLTVGHNDSHFFCRWS